MEANYCHPGHRRWIPGQLIPRSGDYLWEGLTQEHRPWRITMKLKETINSRTKSLGGFFFFLTLPYDLQDLSFWPETEHLAGGSESQESQPLGHQGTPVKADHMSDAQWGQTNLKCRSLEQRKFYCRALYGRQVARALKHTDFPKGYRKTLVKARRGLSQDLWSARAQFSDWLMVGRVMLQELTLSVFWLQEAWSHVLMALKWLTSST